MSSEDWGTETGLFSDYEGIVTDAWFQTDSNVQDGNVYMLSLEIKTEDPDHAQVFERYTCGPDWVSVDGGKTVQHPSKSKFNRNSQMGRLIDRIIEIGAVDVLGGRGTPRDAGIWAGTTWYMEGVTSKGKIRSGPNAGQDYESTKNFPTKFLGLVNPGETKADMSALTAHSVTGMPEYADGAGWARHADFEKVAALAPLAKVSVSHADFMDKAFALPGVMDNNDLVAALAEDGTGSLYQVLKEMG